MKILPCGFGVMLFGFGFGFSVSLSLADDRAPLTASALKQCAAQVEILREESDRIHARNAASEQRRASLNARSAALKDQRDQVEPNDLNASLAVKSSIDLHQSDIRRFNEHVDQLKADIVSINNLKQAYDAACSNRSYRRSDFEKLSTDAQAAMKNGLAGVRVPFLDGRSNQ